MDKRNASFYRKRTRFMEELEEECLNDLREFNNGPSSPSATFPWPDLGVGMYESFFVFTLIAIH